MAIDSHHLITPYLFVAPTILNTQSQIYMATLSSMSEVFVQYIDIFTGMALLYSPTELKDILLLSDLSIQPMLPGEYLKLITPLGDEMDGTNVAFTGVARDEVHQVFNIKTSVNSLGSRNNGSVVFDGRSKIIGIYQGNYYFPDQESLTPSSAFV